MREPKPGHRLCAARWYQREAVCLRFQRLEDRILRIPVKEGLIPIGFGMPRKTKDFRAFRLTDEERLRLLTVQTECTVGWLNSDGWPVTAFLAYLFAHDAFWVTSFRDRPRVACLTAEPRSTVAVSSTGKPLDHGQMVSARTLAVVHDEPASGPPAGAGPRAAGWQSQGDQGHAIKIGDGQGLARLYGRRHRGLLTPAKRVSPAHLQVADLEWAVPRGAVPFRLDWSGPFQSAGAQGGANTGESIVS
jgi:hypothetical protein